MIISQMIALKLLAGASPLDAVDEPVHGSDSSKWGLKPRLLMPDEREDRRIKREDEEVLTLIIAMNESTRR